MKARSLYFLNRPHSNQRATHWAAVAAPSFSLIPGRPLQDRELTANLDKAPDAITFIGFPLNFTGRDGSPIRAVAIA